MKVLIAYSDKYNDDNPYVTTLVNALKNLGCNVTQSLHNFWNCTQFEYNIIHIQWPEALFDWRTPTDIEIQFLRLRLIEVRKFAKIVYTKHNERPHYKDKNKTKIYEIIEGNSDCVIHLGLHSYANTDNSPNTLHLHIPHHIYDQHYTTLYTKNKARELLKLPLNKEIILCFGSFRNEQERTFIKDAFKSIKKRNTILLAPRWFTSRPIPPSGRKIFKRMMHHLRLQNLKLQNIRIAWEFIPDKKVPLYFTAADIILIQRLDTLNSGNITLGMLFKKPIVGPATGNMKTQLEFIKQQIYNPKDASSCTKAMDRCMTQKNETYSSEILIAWSTEEVAKQHQSAYKNLIK